MYLCYILASENLEYPSQTPRNLIDTIKERDIVVAMHSMLR